MIWIWILAFFAFGEEWNKLTVEKGIKINQLQSWLDLEEKWVEIDEKQGR